LRETAESREPSEVWIRLRDDFGYGNIVLESTEARDVKVGDSLEVIGLSFIGGKDFHALEAVWMEKRQ
jgi:hypothetical protein